MNNLGVICGIPVFSNFKNSNCFFKDSFINGSLWCSTFEEKLEQKFPYDFYILRQELVDIQIEAKQTGDYNISNNVLSYAEKILKLLFQNNIEINVSDISANKMNEISFEWNTDNSSIYISVDEFGKINFITMSLNYPYEKFAYQTDINNTDALVERIKHAL